LYQIYIPSNRGGVHLSIYPKDFQLLIYIMNITRIKTMHTNGVDALLRKLPFPLKGEVLPVESSYALLAPPP
jgi:hypothetical protein